MADDPTGPPPALLAKPDLTEEQFDYFAAFWELSPGRSIGMGASGISMADLAAYCGLFGIENAGRFVRYIRACDAEFLAFQEEQSK